MYVRKKLEGGGRDKCMRWICSTERVHTQCVYSSPRSSEPRVSFIIQPGDESERAKDEDIITPEQEKR